MQRLRLYVDRLLTGLKVAVFLYEMQQVTENSGVHYHLKRSQLEWKADN